MINQVPRPPDLPAPDPDPEVGAASSSDSASGRGVPPPDPALELIKAEIRDSPGSSGAGAPGLAVLTGGQTGVDTLGAVAALRAGLRTHLVFPRGMLQEDGPLAPARRRRLRGAVLHELASAEFAARTWSCVRLSDAVVLLDPAGGEGCRETALAAANLGRPLLDLGPATRPISPAEVTAWLRRESARLRPGGALVLQIAGCRASLLTTVQVRTLLSQVEAVITGAQAWCQQQMS